MAYLPEDKNEWPAALLTRKQRERLAGGIDQEKNADKTMLARIRRRLQAGIIDFPLLVNALPPAEIEKVFTDPDQIYPPVRNAVPDALAFFYLANIDRETEPNAPSEGWYFTQLIEAGIQRAILSRGFDVESVSVDIDIERGESFNALVDRELPTLPMRVLRRLFLDGMISAEELREAEIEKAKKNGSWNQDDTDDE